MPTEKKQLVRDAFRRAAIDMYAIGLPDPTIAEVKKGEEVHAGFAIDTRTWKISFDMDSMPEFDPKNGFVNSEDEHTSQFARAEFQHEIGHWVICPYDEVTEAGLIDASMKGLSRQVKSKADESNPYAHTIVNIFGDIALNTHRAEGYGRENFGELTRWQYRSLLKHVAGKLKANNSQPSLMWQSLALTYEKMWDADLGVKDAVTIDKKAEDATDKIVKIMGRDWRDRKTWEPKVTELAKILEPLMQLDQQSGAGDVGDGQGNQQSSGQLIVPEDVKMLMGEDPSKSLLREDQKSSGENPQVTQMLYERHKNDPGGFAGVMGALDGMKPDDALRLMYRARARELLMKLMQEDDEVGERTPSYRTTWKLGDPLTGKNGLDIQQSLMMFPRPIPGLTTVKRTYQTQKGYETIKRTPDLFLEIDSSSSMDWHPWATDPEQRGKFDKAILAAEGAALYALDNGGRVAVINYSGQGQVTQQDYTRDLDAAERALMLCYRGNTFIPVRETVRMIKGTHNPLITALMSDCDLSNPDEANAALREGVTKHDKVTIFKLPEYAGDAFAAQMETDGAIVYRINSINDLVGVVVGAVKAEYDARKPVKAHNIIGLR